MLLVTEGSTQKGIATLQSLCEICSNKILYLRINLENIN
jgi:hypothetical protein